MGPDHREDYDQLNFLQQTPSQTVLVGDDTLLPPALSASLGSWCARVETITSIDTTALVDDLARIIPFAASDWEWFATRYNLTLNDAAAEKRTGSWYDRKGYNDEYSQRWRSKWGRRARGGRGGSARSRTSPRAATAST